MDDKMLHSMIENGGVRTFIWKKSEIVNLEFSIQMILSVTKITEEDGCSLLCQWGHPGHEDAHPGQHCAAPPGDEDTANRDVLWQLPGDKPRHVQDEEELTSLINRCSGILCLDSAIS